MLQLIIVICWTKSVLIVILIHLKKNEMLRIASSPFVMSI